MKFTMFDCQKDDIGLVPSEPGNYIFCLKKDCTLPDIGIPVVYSKFQDYDVIYVGLARKSLRDRDVKKHLLGNAGNSTLRKSLGCLFGYDLIPRDFKYNENGKTKFNISDENRLSEWMKTNLLFFYYANNDYDSLESYLIQKFNPPLNLDKNYAIENLKFRTYLKKMRNNKPNQCINNKKMMRHYGNLSKGLYVSIWESQMDKILSALKNGGGMILMKKDIFEAVGNRNNYSFRLDIINGIVPMKNGSAVARDLKKILDENNEFKKSAKNKNIVIRLNSKIELIVQSFDL